MPRLIDGRDMFPPEPLELTLSALPALGDDEELTLLVRCQPLPLFEALRRAGFSWHEALHYDGTHEVRIRRARST